MFKKFTSEESISSQNQVKSSVSRGIRAKILEQFPNITPHIDEIFPKKTAIFTVKCVDHIQLIAVNQQILFFQEREGPFYPTIRLLHKCIIYIHVT